MRISWITHWPVETRDGELYSRYASCRYRILSPYRTLGQRGHTVNIVRVDPDTVAEQVAPGLEADALVFHYSLLPVDEILAKKAASAGSRIIVDFCDNLFEQLGRARHSRVMAELADTVTAASPAMAETVHRHTGRQAVVIEDPYEGPHGKPRSYTGDEALRLLWYGHPTNLGALQEIVPQLLKFKCAAPKILSIVTRLPPGILQYCQRINDESRGDLTLIPRQWSLPLMWQALAECHAVLIPCARNAWHLVKSPNRAVEALRAGRLVVASPLPAYLELADFVRLGDDIVEALADAVGRTHDTETRIQLGQDYVEQKFSPQAIAVKWESIMTQAKGPEKSGLVAEIQLRGRPPVIIIGAHRSGTTLLAQMLEQLGLFIGARVERNFEALFFLGINEWVLRQCGAFWDEPERLRQALGDQEFRIELMHCIRTQTESPVVETYLGLNYFEKYGHLKALDIPWGWKDPRNTFMLPVWLDLFPTAKVIHIRRHGVDVANSLKQRYDQVAARFRRQHPAWHPKSGQRLDTGASSHSSRCSTIAGAFSLWEEYIAEAERQCTHLDKQLLQLRYEDVLKDPVSGFIQLAEFCGLDQESSRFEKVARQINPGRAFSFRTDAQLSKFARTVTERLQRFGY